MSADVAVSIQDKNGFEKSYKQALTRVDKLVKTHISQAISVQYIIDQVKSSPAFPVASTAAGIVVSTLFPIVDVIEDVICLYEEPGSISNWIFLAIDILCFIPITMVVGRSLKFAMHTVKPAVKNGKKFSAACKEAVESIIAVETIGVIEKAIQEIIAKIDQLKTQLTNKISQIIDTLVGTVDKKINTVGVSGVKADIQAAKKNGEAASKYTLASPFKAENWSNAAEYWGLKGKQAANLASAGTKANPVLLAGGEAAQSVWKKFRGQLLALKPKIQQWINKAIGTAKDGQGILAILSLLLSFVAGRKKTKKTVTPNKTNEAKKTQQTGQATRQRKQDKAKSNANQCDCAKGGGGKAKASTKRSITFALGTEIFSHQDFNLPFAELLGVRTYSSYMSQLDDGVMGARWIAPFNKSLQFKEGEWVYLQEDGRLIQFPEIPIGHRYLHPIEDIEFQYISSDVIVLKDLDETEEIYKKTNADYKLQLIESTDGKRYEFYYDHVIQSQSYLSDIIVKSGTKKIHHVQTELNADQKITSLWLIDAEQKIRKLSEYKYDEHGDLIEAMNEDGARYHYQYEHHLITRYTDLTDRGVNLKWDGTTADAKAVHEWMDGGTDEVKLHWSTDIRATTISNSMGEETVYYYTENGYTYRTIYPDGLEEWFIRDEQERITKHIQPNGESIHYEYDAKGNLLKLVQADGTALYYGYDDQNNLTHFRDGEANIWQREYDDAGHLSLEIDPLNRKTEYQYNDMGLPTTIKDAKGGIKQLEYNAQGQLTQYVDCSGKATQWQYDTRGRTKEVINALQETTQYVYSELGDEGRDTLGKDVPLNAIGQLEKIIHPDATIEHFVHDAEGRLLVHIDPKGGKTQYQYDLAGQISQRIDALGQQLKYQWDTLGRLTQLTNENGVSYQFQYDVMGRLVREIDFDGKETQYHFSENSGELQRSVELAKATRAQQALVHRIQDFEFDAMGRLEKRIAGFAPDVKVEKEYLNQKIEEEFAYDGNGQLVQAENANSRVQFYYNDVGNLSHEHHHDMTTQRTAVWQHLYDELNIRSTSIRPDGQKIDWLSYGSGHVYALALNGEDVVSFKRDDLHREIERHYRNGLSQTQHFDQVGRLISQQVNQGDQAGYQNNAHSTNNSSNANNAQVHTQALLERLYNYDKVGQLIEIKDQRRGKIEYTYDPVGRLLEANSKLGRENFAFDPASNILNASATQAIQPNPQDTHYEPIHKRYGYNQLVDNVVREYHHQQYEYDAFGQMIRQYGNEVLTLEWDALGRLASSKTARQESYYRYDALGRRIEKQKQQQGHSETTIYGWDGDTLAYESTAQQTKHYIYEKDSFIPLIQAIYQQQMNSHDTPQWEHGYDYDKDPLWHDKQRAERFDQVWYYHCDHLGTPQEMSDQAGAIVWTGNYKAWGECKPEQQVKRDIWDSVIITNNIRFQGQYYDEETGLHYNRYRYYSPYVGRFISKDPIGLLGGFNTYAYAPNPVEWVDPLGLDRMPSWMPTKKGYQRQHIIPYSLKGHEVFVKSGMNINSASNMMYMPICEGIDKNENLGLHRGWTDEHAQYNRIVARKLDAIQMKSRGQNWDYRKYQNEVTNLQKELRLGTQTGTYTCASKLKK